MGVHLKLAKNMARFLISFVALFAYANGFCMNMPGGIGEYHHECTTTSIEMDACYARCNCWTDFPDMGGQITHEMDAACFLDALVQLQPRCLSLWYAKDQPL